MALTINNLAVIRNQIHDQKVKEAGVGAATEAATGSTAFFHRQYSKILDAPQTSGGPVMKKIFRLAQLEHMS